MNQQWEEKSVKRNLVYCVDLFLNIDKICILCESHNLVKYYLILK